MMQAVFDRFQHGYRRAVSMSFDDGTVHDRRLVDIFNQHGLKGTFNLSSGFLDQPGHLQADEVASLFQGHEVAVHSVNHPCLTHLPRERLIGEILDDRRTLENLVGYPVRGMAVPGSDYDPRVRETAASLGIVYARQGSNGADFCLPTDFLCWPATAPGASGGFLRKAESFLSLSPLWGLQLLLRAGHSIDFENANSWDQLETYCLHISGQADVWYASMLDIYDYMQATGAIQMSVDGQIMVNPSAKAVWFTDWAGDRHEALVIQPGQTLQFTS